MEWDRILLGGDWNAHGDRWEPQCPQKIDTSLLETLMDEYELVDHMDRELTHTNMADGETAESLINFFITKATLTNRLEIPIAFETTSDQAIVFTLLKWDHKKGVKDSRTITGCGIAGLKQQGEKENSEKAQKW